LGVLKKKRLPVNPDGVDIQNELSIGAAPGITCTAPDINTSGKYPWIFFSFFSESDNHGIFLIYRVRVFLKILSGCRVLAGKNTVPVRNFSVHHDVRY